MRTTDSAFRGVIDTTFRDGQQSPLLFDSFKYRLSREDKKNLFFGLVKLGVRNFEFFSPVVSTSEYEDFLAIKKYAEMLQVKSLRFIAHCRCHPQDIEEALAAGFTGLNLYIGMSKQAQQSSHGHSFAKISTLVKKTITDLRTTYPHLYIRFSAEDCFRTPLAAVYRMYDELYPLVNTFGMPDTVGIATPQLVAKRVRELRRRYPKAALECHFHNDRGLALANSLAAIEQGASYIDTSVWGLAERSGITSITALLFNLYYENKNLCKDYSLEVCYPLNVLMGTILKLQVPSSEPVSLTNRTHTAGVHQKAVLNNPHVYEGHDLSIFGVHTNHLFLGPLSGKNIIYYYLREVCYREVDVQQAALIAQKFKARTQEMNKKNRPEKILLELAQEMNLPKRAVRENYLLRRVENCN